VERSAPVLRSLVGGHPELLRYWLRGVVAFPTIAGLVVHIGVTLNVGMAVAVGVSFAWNRRCSYLWVLSIVGSVATAIGCDALWATSWGHA
jgi:hypothetical protein